MNEELHLERKLSSVNAWALAFGCIIGGSAFLLPGTSFLPKAGPLGSAIALIIAGVIMSIIAFNYNFMIQKFPVAGGEFTYSTNAFGKTCGFICAWFLGISYLMVVPFNATALGYIGRSITGNLFQFGFHYSVAGYEVYLGEILLAFVALVLFGFLSIRGVKFSGVFQTILVFSIIGGIAVVGVAAIISSKATAANLNPVFPTGTGKFSAIFSILAIAPWTLLGFDTIPQAAEEFNFSQKKTKVVMVISIVFGILIYICLNVITASVVPDGYANWADYIADLKNLDGVAAIPTFNAARELLGTSGLVLFGIAVLGAILSGICGFYMAASRLLYSMSKEKVLPDFFGKLHPKYKTPYLSIIFVMVISFFAIFAGRTALVWIVDMTSTGAAIGFGFTSAAAAKFAIKEKKISIAITGVLGTLLSIVFAVLLLVPIEKLGCSLGKESYICLAIWTVLGAAFYIFSSCKKAKEEKIV